MPGPVDDAEGRPGAGPRPVELHAADIDDLPIVWRSAPGADPGDPQPTGGPSPVLYVHGVPESGEQWLPFLERTGGLAPDLPGFGRSAKRGDFPHTIEGYADWLERYLDHVGVDRFRLALHDWGAVGLELAMRAPERVERLVVIDAVPFLPGYRWHWAARMWRRRAVGELLMGATTKFALRRLSGQPAEVVDRWWRDFDQGTQRAILALYRNSPEDRLAAAGDRLERIDCPALVVWGEEDPYLDPSFADAYAGRLARASLRRVPGAGHWPWLDDPGVTGEVCRFLDTGDTP